MKYINILNTLEGWCSEEKATKLYTLITWTRPQKVVEIGVFGGKSLIAQAFALKDNGGGKIIGIDSWSKEDCLEAMVDAAAIDWWSKLDYDYIYNGCVNAISVNGLNDYVELIKKKSADCVDLVGNDIDILHIDGNHEEFSSCRDVKLYLPKLKVGGFLWFDDAGWKQTQKAIKLIEEEFKLVLVDKAQSLDVDNYCGLYKKME